MAHLLFVAGTTGRPFLASIRGDGTHILMKHSLMLGSGFEPRVDGLETILPALFALESQFAILTSELLYQAICRFIFLSKRGFYEYFSLFATVSSFS